MFIPFSLNSGGISEFFILEFSYKHGWNLYVYYLLCVLSFPDYYVTYCYGIVLCGFSGRELGHAPAHFKNPCDEQKMRKTVHLLHMEILDRCVPAEKF